MAKPKSPHEMFQVMKGNIEEKTGRSLETWVTIGKATGIDTFKALTDHMKQEHGMTHGYAQLVAWGVLDPARLEAGNQDQSMVDELYQGKKMALRPIYEALVKQGADLGNDVELVICKTYSSFRAQSQFAVVAPRTNSAVDLELALSEGTPTSSRLERFKSSNSKFTHRIRITNPDEIDAEVAGALKRAYELNARS